MKFGALRRWSAIVWTQVMESALIRGRTFNDSMSLQAWLYDNCHVTLCFTFSREFRGCSEHVRLKEIRQASGLVS